MVSVVRSIERLSSNSAGQSPSRWSVVKKRLEAVVIFSVNRRENLSKPWMFGVLKSDKPAKLSWSLELLQLVKVQAGGR